MMSSRIICISFPSEQHFYHPVVKLSLHQCQPHIPVHSQDLASEEFQRR